MENASLKKGIVLTIWLIALLWLGDIAISPPGPHNVVGRVTTLSGNGVQNGIPVFINDTTFGSFVQTYTNAPPIPQLLGSYSATITGEDNDAIIVIAWNATHYGQNASVLAPTTTSVNVVINTSRPSEPNVTILFPANNSVVNKTVHFNLTANISMFGNDGINCNATISFSNLLVINVTVGENLTHFLGNITLSNHSTTTWTVAGKANATANITVAANCESDGRKFENTSNRYMLHNVTIQNLRPIVNNVGSIPLIELVPGNNLSITCNATITDYNTEHDIRIVNASLYQEIIGSTSADDFNYHYSNSSCVNLSSNVFERNYTCSFDVAYFANNGSWVCNISAFDYSNSTLSNYTPTFVNDLLALDVSPSAIDFGIMSPSQTSSEDVNVTITNFGNLPLNLTIDVYGSADGDNVSMSCAGGGNISIKNERYSVFYGLPFSEMQNTSDDPALVTNFTLFQRTNDMSYGNDRNLTFWKVSVPAGIRGICNGTVVFGARAA